MTGPRFSPAEVAAYVKELEQAAADVRAGRARFVDPPDDDVVMLLPLPDEWAEAMLGPLETCDLCRLDWPATDLEPVEWTDTAGEVWERRFCSICREQQGL